MPQRMHDSYIICVLFRHSLQYDNILFVVINFFSYFLNTHFWIYYTISLLPILLYFFKEKNLIIDILLMCIIPVDFRKRGGSYSKK